jgi:7,8-dihydroneopterin aldolase/epimerase/oxygenase
MPHKELDAITLHGMSFHTLIGVLPHEREHPQPLEIDVTAWVEPGEDVVDYRRLYGDVRAAIDAPKLYYLEELANSIAERILRENAVQRVRVAVRKPHAALGGPLDYAEVAVVRERDA